MSYYGLQAVVGTAIVDRQFRDALLEDAEGVIGGFDLTEEEFGVVASIRANSLEQFAAQLHDWLTTSSPPLRRARWSGIDYRALRLAG
ncbi:MAG: Os1348 family NHLP clan protein [Chloroflexi bacterium]|nr:Os1348 family NHLP clan protein [Chloroflexota bacterium]